MPRTFAKIIRGLTAAVFALLAASAALKFIDLAAFGHALREWSTLPDWSHALLVPTLPVIELSLAAWYLLRRGTRQCVAVTAGFILVLTIGLAVEAVAGDATGCGCFGRLPALLSIEQGMTLALSRNTILLLVLVLWHFTGTSGSELHTRRAPVAMAGFTLIEVLVCLMIFGLLSTLVLAALGAARQRSRQASVSMLLRQHAAVMTIYAGDHKDCLPYVTRPAPEPTVIATAASDRTIELLYFNAFFGWSAGLADSYYDGRHRAGPFRSPFWRPSAPGEFTTGINDFFYPCVFLASPEYWNLETRLVPPAQLTPTRSSMVAFPSRKSLIVHDIAHHAPSFAAAFVDGHADSLYSRLIRPEVNDDGDPGRRFGGHLGVGGPRMLHAFEGSKGVDLP